MVLEIESAHIKATNVDEWVNGTSYIVPNRDATVIQVYDLATVDGVCEIIYKYLSLGLPADQAYRAVLGKCVASDGTNGGVIALEVW